jgi:hypothetical protein
MLLRRALCAIAPLFLAVALAPAHADNAAVKKAILAGYAAEDAALTKKPDDKRPVNFAGFNKVHTADATVTFKGQSAKIAQFRDKIKLVAVFGKSVKAKSTMSSLTVKGNKALAVTKLHLDVTANLGNMAAQAGKAGVAVDPNKPSHIVLNVNQKDTWVKGPAGWQIKDSTFLTFTGTIDGKPLPKGINQMLTGGGGGKGRPHGPVHPGHPRAGMAPAH